MKEGRLSPVPLLVTTQVPVGAAATGTPNATWLCGTAFFLVTVFKAPEPCPVPPETGRLIFGGFPPCVWPQVSGMQAQGTEQASHRTHTGRLSHKVLNMLLWRGPAMCGDVLGLSRMF